MFLSPLKIVVRLIVGFVLGWLLSSLVGLLGLGVLAVAFGGLDNGLNHSNKHGAMLVIMPIWIASMIGAWVASTVSPLFIRKTSLRRPFLTSCCGSAALSILANIVIVGGYAFIYQEQYPDDPRGIFPGLFVISVVLSLISAWCVNNDLNRAYGIRVPTE